MTSSPPDPSFYARDPVDAAIYANLAYDPQQQEAFRRRVVTVVGCDACQAASGNPCVPVAPDAWLASGNVHSERVQSYRTWCIRNRLKLLHPAQHSLTLSVACPECRAGTDESCRLHGELPVLEVHLTRIERYTEPRESPAVAPDPIVAFLTARLDEEYAVWSRSVFRAHARAHLADIETKRAIVRWHENWPVLLEKPLVFDQGPTGDAFSTQSQLTQWVAWLTQREYVRRFGSTPPTAPVLRFLVGAYADHPEYREEWRL